MCTHAHTHHTHTHMHTHTCTHAHTHTHAHIHTPISISLWLYLCFLKAWKALSVGKFFLLSVSVLNMTPREVSLVVKDTLPCTGTGGMAHTVAVGANGIYG